MKRLSSKIRTSIVALAAVVVGVTGLSTTNAAGPATLTLQPSGGSYLVGSNFTVLIYENSAADPVNAVQANLTYNAGQLEFVGINSAGSAFGIEAEASGGSGSVRIGRGSISSLTGSQLVSQVTFKVLGNSGNAVVTFASSSAIARTSDSENIWNESPTGGSYTMTAPATPPSTPPPSTPPPSTPPPSNPPANQPNPVVADDQPVPVAAQSGITSYQVAIKVLDSDNNPVPGVDVKLGENTVKSDADGIASFPSIPAGEYTVTTPDASLKITVVANSDNTGVQQFDVKPDASSGSSNIKLYIIIAAVLVALAVAGYELYRRLQALRKRKASNTPIEGIIVGNGQVTTPGTDPTGDSSPIVVHPETKVEVSDNQPQPPTA